MKPWRRVTLELLGPPALGALLMVVWGGAESAALHAESPAKAVGVFFGAVLHWPLYAVFAYCYAAIPSVICTLVMEFCFARRLDPASGWTVMLLSVLGALSGAMIAAMLGGFSDARFSEENWRVVRIFTALGLVVGAILGGVICWRTRVARRRNC